MYQSVTEHDFREAFRSIRPDNFSHEALGLLYEWFENYEEQTDKPFELDVIAVCCDFSEESWEAIADNYGIDTSHCETEEEGKQEVIDHLCYNTLFIGQTDTTLVYMAY